MKCRTCKEKLKNVPRDFDALSILNPVTLYYCENKECAEFGYVVVVGYPDEQTLPTNK